LDVSLREAIDFVTFANTGEFSSKEDIAERIDFMSHKRAEKDE
jgi:hypothetical protein